MENSLQPQTLFGNLWNKIRRGRAQNLIVALVLLISAGLAIVASDTLIYVLLALSVLLISFFLLIYYPALGILLIMIAGLSAPITLRGGINLSVVGVALLAILWIVDMTVRQRNIRFAESVTNLPIVVFIISALVSFVNGQIPWYPSMRQAPVSAQLGGFLIFILSAAAFLLVGNLVRNIRWLQTFTWFFIAASGLYLVGRLSPFASQYLRHIFQSGATTGSLFWVWLCVLPFSQALYNTKLNKLIRVGLLGFVLVALYVAVFLTNDWKSGYIPPLAGMGVIFALWLKKRVWLLFPFIPVVIWIISLQAISSDQYSYSTRMDAWRIVVELSSINPVFGMGFANYYWYTPLMSISGYFINFNSHSQYVDILAQTGVIGLFAFGWVFWRTGWLGWRLRDKVPEGFVKAYVFGILGGLVATLVAGVFVDWVLPFTYNIGMNGFRASVLSWIFMGGLVSIEQILHNQGESGVETKETLQRRGV